MAIWLSKRAPIGEWGGIQFRLILAQQESKSQLHYAMLARTGPLGEPDDVFILLPDDGPLDRFSGFDVIDVQNIPSGVRVLVGSAEVLAQLYPELKGKIAQP